MLLYLIKFCTYETHKKKYADTFTQCVSILYMKIRFFQQKKEIFQDYFYIIRIFAEDAVPITEDTAMSGCSDRGAAAADGDTVHTLYAIAILCPQELKKF